LSKPILTKSCRAEEEEEEEEEKILDMVYTVPFFLFKTQFVS